MAIEYARPDADSAAGGWTTSTGSATSLFATLDETTASDADYVQSPVRSAASADLIVRLYQSSTLIATWTHTGIAETYVDVEQILTAPQLAAITNFNNLFLEFDDNAGGVYRTSLGNPTTALTTPVKVSYRYRGLVEAAAPATGTGALIVPSSIVAGAGTVSAGAPATGTAALIALPSIVAGVGTASAGVRTGTGALIVPSSIVAGTGTAASGGGGTVSFVAQTGFHSNPGVTFFNIAPSPGFDSTGADALIVALAQVDGATAFTSPTVEWDADITVGTHQFMTLLGTGIIHSVTAPQVCVCLFGLRAPVQGQKALRLAWTTAAQISASCYLFSGVKQTNDATAFTGFTSASDVAPISLVISAAVGDMVVGAFGMAAGNFTSTTGTGVLDNTGSSYAAAAAYDNGAAPTKTVTAFPGNATYAAGAGICVKAA